MANIKLDLLGMSSDELINQVKLTIHSVGINNPAEDIEFGSMSVSIVFDTDIDDDGNTRTNLVYLIYHHGECVDSYPLDYPENAIEAYNQAETLLFRVTHYKLNQLSEFMMSI